MHALIDIERAEASRFDDIASTLRKAASALETAEGALYKLLDNYKPYSGKGEGGGEPFALKVEREVRHDGEYVLTSRGSKDFGEITQEIADAIGRQAGKIRLRRGVQVDGLFKGALKKIVTYGHSQKYWKENPEHLEMEVVANFFETRGSDDKRLKVVKEVFPNAYKYFEDFVKTL